MKFGLTHNYLWYGSRYYQKMIGIAMGATVSLLPALLTFYMSKWEIEKIFMDQPPKLKCYWRIIDDIMLIWKGHIVCLNNFTHHLDTNDKNIMLDRKIEKRRIKTSDWKIQWLIYKKDTLKKMCDMNGYITKRELSPSIVAVEYT